MPYDGGSFRKISVIESRRVDQLSIEQLFLRYGPGVGSYLMARLGNAELAEEITSRVFLTVVRRVRQVPRLRRGLAVVDRPQRAGPALPRPPHTASA